MSWYFVRHGETVWNVEHRLQGARNIPLNSRGREQAGHLHDVWEREGLRFSCVYVSPLERAVETAEILTGQDRSTFCVDERLREMSFGAMEGEKYRGRIKADMSLCMENFLGKPSRYVPSEGGETFMQVIARAGEFLAEEGRKHDGAKENILVVSHGAMLHGLLFHLEHRTNVDEFWESMTLNCEPIVFEQIQVNL